MLWLLYIVVAIFGTVSGFSNFELLHSLGHFISNVFIKIFRCISLPIVSLSIIVALSQYGINGLPRKIWKKTLFYTINTTVIAATIAAILYLLINPPNISDPLLSTNNNTSINKSDQNTYLTHLTTLIPSNILAPFLEHQIMSVFLLSITIGIAIRYIRDETSRVTTINFFKGLNGMFLVIARWISNIIPLALFGFITTAIVEIKSGIDIKGLGAYLTVIILANITQGFVILPIFLLINKINPLVVFRTMLPALSVAFFSKSSAVALPTTIQTIEQNLGVSPKISRFVLPLCISINMNGCAAFIFTTIIYLMQNNGIEINFLTIVTWIFVSTIAAVGNAGVPMGCFFLSTSLLTNMDIPITIVGFILPFYAIIDMIETTTNVWSDACITKVVSEHNKSVL